MEATSKQWLSYRFYLALTTFISICIPIATLIFAISYIDFRPHFHHVPEHFDVIVIISGVVIALLLAALMYFLLLTYRLRQGDRLLKIVIKNLDTHNIEATIQPVLASYCDDSAGVVTNFLLELQKNLTAYKVNLENEITKRQRINSELELVAHMQKQLLFSKFDDPYNENIDVAACLYTAHEGGGGDLYDCFYIDKDHLLVAVGDACDKGVPACVQMIKSIMILRTLTKSLDKSIILSPAKLLTLVSNEFFENDGDKVDFITYFIGILNIPKQEFTFSNAGHNYPVIKKNKTVEFLKQDKNHLPIGLKEDIDYSDTTIPFSEDMFLFLYTDGFPEAFNGKQYYSDSRMISALQGRLNLNADDIINGVTYDVKSYVTGVPQSDDMAALVLRWKQAENDSSKEKEVLDGKIKEISHEYSCELSQISLAQERLADFLHEEKVSREIIHDMAVCVEEVMANIIQHANVDDDAKLQLEVAIHGRGITLKFIDSGIPFDPTMVNITDVNTLDDGQAVVGRRGITLIEKLTDKLYYQRIENTNVLTLVKWSDHGNHRK